MNKLIAISLLLTGCGTFQAGPTGISGEGSAITDREGAFYLAQRDAAIAAAQAAAAPIFVLEAAPGQTLRIEGLERIAVSAPGTGQAISVQQYVNPWAAVVGQIGTAVLPLAVGQYGAYKIVQELGETTQAVSEAVTTMGSESFASLAQSGEQTAEVAIHGQDQIAALGQAGLAQTGATAAAGFEQIGSTAATGIEATAATGQAGITGVQQTAQSGFNALTTLSIEALRATAPTPVLPSQP